MASCPGFQTETALGTGDSSQIRYGVAYSQHKVPDKISCRKAVGNMTGTVTEIYRYPVKGLSGEALGELALKSGQTVPGDRLYALGRPGFYFDTDKPVWMPKTNFLALVRDARLAELTTQYDDATSVLTVARHGHTVLSAKLSEHRGREALEAFFEKFMAQDISGRPTLLHARGHSFSDLDAKVVSLINLDTVRDLEAQTGQTIDPIRFRANLYFEGLPAWRELDWTGQMLKAGTARLEIVKRTQRCAATNVNPATAQRDMNIPAALQKNRGHTDLGVYARVVTGGTIRPGDRLTLESD